MKPRIVGLFFFYLAHENRSVRDSDVSGKSKRSGGADFRPGFDYLSRRCREDNGGFPHLLDPVTRTGHMGQSVFNNNFLSFACADLPPFHKGEFCRRAIVTAHGRPASRAVARLPWRKPKEPRKHGGRMSVTISPAEERFAKSAHEGKVILPEGVVWKLRGSEGNPPYLYASCSYCHQSADSESEKAVFRHCNVATDNS